MYAMPRLSQPMPGQRHTIWPRNNCKRAVCASHSEKGRGIAGVCLLSEMSAHIEICAYALDIKSTAHNLIEFFLIVALE